MPAEKLIQFNTIVVPCEEDIDIRCAKFLLKNSEPGKKKFPGIENASEETWGCGVVPVDGKLWGYHADRGVLLLGVGGSPYDKNHRGNRHASCVTQLVAKDLGLYGPEYSEYKHLLDTVIAHTAGKMTVLHGLQNSSRYIYRATNVGEQAKTEKAIHDYTTLLFWSMIKRREGFVEGTKDFENAQGEPIWTKGPDPKQYQIMCVTSDAYEIGAAGRKIHKDLAVLVVRKQDGHVQIFGNKQLPGGERVQLYRVAAEVRRLELIKAGKKDEAKKFSKILAQPGQLDIEPKWKLTMDGLMLLNSDESAPDVDVTALSDDDIMKVVWHHTDFVLNPDAKPCPIIE